MNDCRRADEAQLAVDLPIRSEFRHPARAGLGSAILLAGTCCWKADLTLRNRLMKKRNEARHHQIYKETCKISRYTAAVIRRTNRLVAHGLQIAKLSKNDQSALDICILTLLPRMWQQHTLNPQRVTTRATFKSDYANLDGENEIMFFHQTGFSISNVIYRSLFGSW